MNDLAILCPSRERPQSCARMVASCPPDADVIVYVDDDDPTRKDYERSSRYTLVKRGAVGRGEAINYLCDAFRGYRMYLVVSDDIVFDRHDWVSQVRAAMDGFNNDIGLVHLESENHEPYVNWAVVSRNWLDTLGFFNHPGCRWFCQDTILQALGEGLDRIVQIHPQCLTHVIESHPESENRLRQDEHAFLWYMARHFGSDLKKLRDAR